MMVKQHRTEPLTLIIAHFIAHKNRLFFFLYSISFFWKSHEAFDFSPVRHNYYLVAFCGCTNHSANIISVLSLYNII